MCLGNIESVEAFAQILPKNSYSEPEQIRMHCPFLDQSRPGIPRQSALSLTSF